MWYRCCLRIVIRTFWFSHMTHTTNSANQPSLCRPSLSACCWIYCALEGRALGLVATTHKLVEQAYFLVRLGDVPRGNSLMVVRVEQMPGNLNIYSYQILKEGCVYPSGEIWLQFNICYPGILATHSDQPMLGPTQNACPRNLHQNTCLD